jgi:hypothetical protein
VDQAFPSAFAVRVARIEKRNRASLGGALVRTLGRRMAVLEREVAEYVGSWCANGLLCNARIGTYIILSSHTI